MKLAERINTLGNESAFDVLMHANALEAAGRDIIHLEIGEPDFPTPAHIVAAAKLALDEGWTHYGSPQGLSSLREAIASYANNMRKISADPENVCVVPGGKPIIFFLMLALLEPGDEVIYPNPGFFIYESMIRFCGAKAVPLPLLEEERFGFDLNRLAECLSPKTKLLILNSPHNPTGSIVPAEDLAAIREMVRDRDLIILSDETYSQIYFSDTVPLSIASLPGMLEKTVVLDGFSKTYAMTGWRIGYGIMPRWLVSAVNKLMINSNSCTASFTQRAAVAALAGPRAPVEAMVSEFRKRRDVFCAALNGVPGFRCMLPEGGFYAFVNVRSSGLVSQDLASLLLEEGGVACVGGRAFGEFGDGYVRFSYVDSLDRLLEANRRIMHLSQQWAVPSIAAAT
jgi:aspartate/methionine/tyrosine aminotransferase